MMNNDSDNIKVLIVKHNERLQILKEQEATYGISVDPKIPLEIKEIEKKITDLQVQLQELDETEKCSSLPSVSASTNMLHQIWNSLEPDLQDALSLSYNQACREGENKINVYYFFAAVARLKSGPLSVLLELLPKDAIPDPIEAGVTTEQLILNVNLGLSACMFNSLYQLSSRTTQNRKINSTDMFVDLAKYSTGKSVELLRQHNVLPETIDELVNGKGWDLLER